MSRPRRQKPMCLRVHLSSSLNVVDGLMVLSLPVSMPLCTLAECIPAAITSFACSSSTSSLFTTSLLLSCPGLHLVWSLNHQYIGLVYSIALLILVLANFYLTTVVILDLVGDPTEKSMAAGAVPFPFGDRGSEIVNTIIKFLYVALLLLQFILALGNRPKG